MVLLFFFFFFVVCVLAKYGSNFIYMFAVSFPASNPLWRPELALVEYSPKKSNDHPEGPEPLNEGNI